MEKGKEVKEKVNNFIQGKYEEYFKGCVYSLLGTSPLPQNIIQAADNMAKQMIEHLYIPKEKK